MPEDARKKNARKECTRTGTYQEKAYKDKPRNAPCKQLLAHDWARAGEGSYYCAPSFLPSSSKLPCTEETRAHTLIIDFIRQVSKEGRVGRVWWEVGPATSGPYTQSYNLAGIVAGNVPRQRTSQVRTPDSKIRVPFWVLVVTQVSKACTCRAYSTAASSIQAETASHELTGRDPGPDWLAGQRAEPPEDLHLLDRPGCHGRRHDLRHHSRHDLRGHLHCGHRHHSRQTIVPHGEGGPM